MNQQTKKKEKSNIHIFIETSANHLSTIHSHTLCIEKQVWWEVLNSVVYVIPANAAAVCLKNFLQSLLSNSSKEKGHRKLFFSLFHHVSVVGQSSSKFVALSCFCTFIGASLYPNNFYKKFFTPSFLDFF